MGAIHIAMGAALAQQLVRHILRAARSLRFVDPVEKRHRLVLTRPTNTTRRG